VQSIGHGPVCAAAAISICGSGTTCACVPTMGIAVLPPATDVEYFVLSKSACSIRHLSNDVQRIGNHIGRKFEPADLGFWR